MKPQLIILVCIILPLINSAFGQDSPYTELEEIGYNWVAKYSFLKDSALQIPDRTVSNEQAIKSGKKIIKNLEKSISKFEKGKKTKEDGDILFKQNTNASLWYKNIQSEDFHVLLRKLLTSTQISPKHIHSLRDAYHKWIISPTIKNLYKYSEVLSGTGRSYEILCRISVNKVPNATQIKYMDITGNQVKTLDKVKLEKVVRIGNYYIWLEEGGEEISDRSDLKYCINNNQKVEFKPFNSSLSSSLSNN